MEEVGGGWKCSQCFHIGAYPQNWAHGLLTQKGYTKQANWLNWLLNWIDLPTKRNQVINLRVCQFLVSTAKCWGLLVPTQGILKERPTGQMAPAAARGLAPIFPDWKPASHQHWNSNWLSQVVRDQACSAHHDRRWICARWGDEARKITLFKKADQDNGRLVPQNNHLVKAWLPGSFLDERWGWGGGRRWGKQSKNYSILANVPRMASLTVLHRWVAQVIFLQAGHYECL